MGKILHINHGLLVIMTITMIAGIQSQNQDVATTINRLLKVKQDMLSKMSSMKSDLAVGYDPINRFGRLLEITRKKGKNGIRDLQSRERARFKTFVKTLKDLKERVKDFYNIQQISSMDRSSQSALTAFKTYTKQNENGIDLNGNNGPKDPLKLLSSFTLSHYNNRRAASLFHAIRRSLRYYNGKPRIDASCDLVKKSKDKDPHAFPDLHDITLTNICPDYYSCTRNTHIYSNKQSHRIALSGRKEYRRKQKEGRIDLGIKYTEEDVSDSCIILARPEFRNRCNLPFAVPFMTGLLKFEINEMIYQNLCPGNCDNGKCYTKRVYEKLIEDINRLIGFVASNRIYYEKSFWKDFFQDAINRRAFAKLNVALNMVEEKKDNFEVSSFQCHLVRLKESCPYADIFRQYTVLKKMQRKKSENIRIKDLRKYSRMNYAEMIRLQRDDIKHTELLGTIKNLDDNLKTSVKGISKYFEGLAKFDEGIALADVGYITSSLSKFERDLASVEGELHRDISQAMQLMQTVITVNLAEAVAKLAIAIALNSNPLKIIFTGPDVTDIMDRADAVANAAADMVRGFKIIFSIQQLADDAFELNKAFGVNSRQLDSLDKLVDLIRNGRSEEIGLDADKFLNSYGAYTPATELAKLEKNNALWSAFKDSICELLYGEVGVSGSAFKSLAGEKLLCERLEGTLAQYFTLREQIYDFQFDLVDSLAAVVRGNIAKKLSTDIGKGTVDLIDGKQLMTGFFLMQYKIQKVSAAYCNILEYKQLGKPVKPCATTDGLFIDENIKALIAYSGITPYNEITRDVFLPTRADANGDIDTGIIDLNALSKGQAVLFKIPVDQKWLEKYKWLLPGETAIPFIKSIKLYLPHKVYDNTRLLTTQITLTSVSGSVVTTVNPNAGVVYMLPKAENTYSTIYEEGYSSCTNEIDNPYSLCSNLPKICDKTRRISGQTLLPTILSTFSLKARIDHGSTKEKYDAPSPGTPLLLRAKVVLKMPLASTKRSKLPTRSIGSGVVTSTDGCCTGQMYRLSLNDMKCGHCPRDTTAYHRGLYCQINEKKTKRWSENLNEN